MDMDLEHVQVFKISFRIISYNVYEVIIYYVKEKERKDLDLKKIEKDEKHVLIAINLSCLSIWSILFVLKIISY